MIALDQNGKISFDLLQHHRSQAQALLLMLSTFSLPG